MNYNRPEVRVLGPAIVAIQSTTGSKETKPYPDAPYWRRSVRIKLTK